MGTAEPSIWPNLIKLWRSTCEGHLSGSSDGEISKEEQGVKDLSINLAKFTRNLVAGEDHNQTQAL
jgi:hypothetical protein